MDASLAISIISIFVIVVVIIVFIIYEKNVIAEINAINASGYDVVRKQQAAIISLYNDNLNTKRYIPFPNPVITNNKNPPTYPDIKTSITDTKFLPLNILTGNVNNVTVK